MFRVYMFIGLAAIIAMGVAYHFYTVNSLEKNIAALVLNNQTLNQQVVSQQEAAVINEATIASLNNNITEQGVRLQSLSQRIDAAERDRDEYVSIFRRHNLTNLARRRPGLIETRINSGTAEVFADLIDTTTGVEAELLTPEESSEEIIED